MQSHLPHIHHTPDAIASLHIGESLVDTAQVLPVSNELINLELAIKIILDEARKLRTALDTAERTTLPDTTGDELEC